MVYSPRRAWCKRFLASAPLAILALMSLSRQDSTFAALPAPILTRVYGSCPKGIILEGVADGIEKSATVQYLIDQNRFILNKDTAAETSYFSPVPRDTLYHLAMALARDDRLGVSLGVTGKEIIYGALSPRAALVKSLFAADKFLTAVALGDRAAIANYAKTPLPFTPRETTDRRFPAIVVHKFFAYRFAKYNSQYYLASVKMANVLLPMADFPAADGGFAAQNNLRNLESADRENIQNLQQYSADFFDLPVVKAAAAIGEAAAFLRNLRDQSQVDLVALARYIMRK